MILLAVCFFMLPQVGIALSNAGLGDDLPTKAMTAHHNRIKTVLVFYAGLCKNFLRMLKIKRGNNDKK
jgi:hypothetical protein